MQATGIHKKVNDLMRRLGAVEKNHSVQAGGSYKYRSYSDLFAAMQPLLIELGIVQETRFEPAVMSTVEMKTSRGETTGTMVGGTLIVDLIDIVDGSRLTYSAPTLSIDNSDKAAGKAMSYGIKNALFAGLQIPVEEEKDHDATRPQLGLTKLKALINRAKEASKTLGSPESLAELKAIAREGQQLQQDDQRQLSEFLTLIKQEMNS